MSYWGLFSCEKVPFCNIFGRSHPPYGKEKSKSDEIHTKKGRIEDKDLQRNTKNIKKRSFENEGLGLQKY